MPAERAARTPRRDRVWPFEPDDPPSTLAETPMLAHVLELWRGWRDGRIAPEREDLDPLSLRSLLPNIVLLDVLDDDFRFRLVGESVNIRYRHQPKGRTLRELLQGQALDDTLCEHRLCAEGLQAVLVRNSCEAVSLDDLKVYTRLLLPLGVRDGRATHILGAMEFGPQPV